MQRQVDAIRSPRIGIIGAGPGGLTLARLLTERGITDVTLLERQSRPGGKSLTFFHEGIGHELGACYTALGYRQIKRWMAEAGMHEHRYRRQMILTEGGKLIEFKDFVGKPAGLVGMLAQVTRYARAWYRFHNWDLQGGPDDADGTAGRLMREEVAESFRAWLDVRGLDLIARFSLRAVTVMGYGALDQVPALYGLRWVTPTLLATGGLNRIKEPVPGWDALWAHLAGTLDVRTSVAVEAVLRRTRGFSVCTNRGEFAFDHLVIASPLDEATSFFPFDDDERWDLAVAPDELTWRDFVSTLVEVEGWFRDVDTWCSEAQVKDAATIANGRLIGARRTGDKSPVARARSKTRSDVYVCYQYGGSRRSDEDLLVALREDLASQGATVRKVHRQCRWKYAPQLRPAAIRSGAVWRMERRQGRGNLWISGATACHETVWNITNYNARLAQRMVISFAGGDPSSPEVLSRLAGKYRFALGQT
jgi:hypothetical protein